MSGQQIQRLQHEQRPTLLETKKGNELIDALNALQNCTIQYGETFDVVYGSNEVAFTIPLPEEQQAQEQVEFDAQKLTLNFCMNGVTHSANFYIEKGSVTGGPIQTRIVEEEE